MSRHSTGPFALASICRRRGTLLLYSSQRVRSSPRVLVLLRHAGSPFARSARPCRRRAVHTGFPAHSPASTPFHLQLHQQQQAATTSAPPPPPKLTFNEAQAQKSDNKFNIRGTFTSGRSVYLDMQATTPTDPRVLDA